MIKLKVTVLIPEGKLVLMTKKTSYKQFPGTHHLQTQKDMKNVCREWRIILLDDFQHLVGEQLVILFCLQYRVRSHSSTELFCDGTFLIFKNSPSHASFKRIIRENKSFLNALSFAKASCRISFISFTFTVTVLLVQVHMRSFVLPNDSL